MLIIIDKLFIYLILVSLALLLTVTNQDSENIDDQVINVIIDLVTVKLLVIITKNGACSLIILKKCRTIESKGFK